MGLRRFTVRALVSVVFATAISHSGLLWFSVPRANDREALTLTIQYLGRYTSFITLVFGLLAVPVLFSGLLDAKSRTLLHDLCQRRGLGENEAGRAETAASLILLGILSTLGNVAVVATGLVQSHGLAFSSRLLPAQLASLVVCWAVALLIVLLLLLLRRAESSSPLRLWFGVLCLPELLILFEPSLSTYRTIAFDLGRWIVRMGAN
jgi:hypothetical protein